MSNEHDSWFKSAFGVDLGEAVDKVKDAAAAAVARSSKAVADVAAGAGPSGAGGGSLQLGGSVGRGGQNAPRDVSAVQAALGIAADGQCGSQTIAAIKTLQRKLGHAKPDGRVDAGGETERMLASSAKPEAVQVGESLVESHDGFDARSASDGDGASASLLPGSYEPEFKADPAQGSLVQDLLEHQAALMQSLQNAGSDAEREQINEELEGINAEISSELWTLEAAEAIEGARSPEALARAEAFRQLNPQLEQRYLTASGSFTQGQLDAQRISRGINAARMGVAAAGTLWATDDVGLAELVGTASGAVGSLAKPLAPVTGRSTVPPSPLAPSAPIGGPATDVAALPRSTMLASATKPGRGGTSPIGTAIQSHAKRAAKAFSSAGGNAKENTEIGRKLLVDLFSDSQTTVTRRAHKTHGEVIDVRRPNGTGAAFTPKGEFLNLLEPYTPRPDTP